MVEALLTKHNFKIRATTLITALSFVIYWSYMCTSLVDRLIDVEILASKNTEITVKLQNDSIENKIQMAKIQEQLANINLSLNEIKLDLSGY